MRANKEKLSEEKEAQSDKLCDTRLIITQRWWKKISRLKPDDRAELCYAVVAYAFSREDPRIMSAEASDVWSDIFDDIQRRNKYKRKAVSQQKLEKEKDTEKEAPLPPLTPEEKEILKEKDAAAREFDETMKSRYPNVAALTVKMTYDDYLRLLLRWPIEMVREKLAEMNRYPKISEYVDAYRTCIKWLQIEKKHIEKDGRWDIYQKKVEEQKQQVMKFITKK